MKRPVTLPAATLACLFALSAAPVSANPVGGDEAKLEVAEKACLQRAVEGSQYRIEDAEVTSAAMIEADRYQIDVSSPNGDFRCVVTGEGEIFTADEKE